MGPVDDNSVSTPLDKTTLIRDVYRSLLNTGRAYAGFETRHLEIVDSLSNHGQILDPMSGYGGLMRHCSRHKPSISTYGMECNPPAYLWQVLVHPGNADVVEAISDRLLNVRSRWPRSRSWVALSDSWFPKESLNILESLWHTIKDVSCAFAGEQSEEVSLALLLPFVGRLSSTIQGSGAIHVKEGGLCVLHEWRKDFARYLSIVKKTAGQSKGTCTSKHVVRLGDARSIDLGKMQFSAMLTSPPYPNRGDYSRIFAPENYFLHWLHDQHHIRFKGVLQDRLIGALDVSEQHGVRDLTYLDTKSKSAREFLSFIYEYKGTRKAQYDNKVYYLPYYYNYFRGLEAAYENISRYLASEFVGCIIVVNNTARKKVIPVSDFVRETWERLGFSTSICKTRELSHMGGINPRVKGLSARHAEYIIEVKR